LLFSFHENLHFPFFFLFIFSFVYTFTHYIWHFISILFFEKIASIAQQWWNRRLDHFLGISWQIC
jgi:hypothetical protein